MIMGALGFIEGRVNAGNHDVPSEDEIKQFLSGKSSTPPFVYLCRCGSHPRIVRAIQHAAEEMVS
jgi:aerobic-type carbon monoxide dehydrogenase small subunit (CoxS/CutS family)